MTHNDTPTECSCRLPAGHYGAGGWHFGIASEEGLIRMELHRRAKKDPVLRNLLDNYAKSFRDAAIEARFCREKKLVLDQDGDLIRSGVGKAWAYEMCPEKRRMREAAILRRKGEERSGGKDAGWISDEQD